MLPWLGFFLPAGVESVLASILADGYARLRGTPYANSDIGKHTSLHRRAPRLPLQPDRDEGARILRQPIRDRGLVPGQPVWEHHDRGWDGCQCHK